MKIHTDTFENVIMNHIYMYCRWGPAINCLCLSKAKNWIFNVLYRSIIVFSELR